MLDTKKKFWFFIDKNIEEITKEIHEILCLAEYYHDFEDTWEWCESCVREEHHDYFDIYREHINGYGRYGRPVIFKFSRLKNARDEKIEKVSIQLSRKLGVRVYWGLVEWQRLKKNDYDAIYDYEIHWSAYDGIIERK